MAGEWTQVPDVAGIGLLWVCPDCGKKFVQRNSSHSCGPHTVEAYLEGLGSEGLALWEALQQMVASIGPYELVANRHNVGFMVRARFAGVFSLSDRGMTLQFWLKRAISSPRFQKVEFLPPSDWIYRVRIRQVSDLDQEVLRWLRQSYRVGAQRG